MIRIYTLNANLGYMNGKQRYSFPYEIKKWKCYAIEITIKDVLQYKRFQLFQSTKMTINSNKF